MCTPSASRLAWTFLLGSATLACAPQGQARASAEPAQDVSLVAPSVAAGSPVDLSPRPSPPAPELAPRSFCATDDTVDILAHDVELELDLEPPSLAGSGRLLLRARRTTNRVALDVQGPKVLSVGRANAALPFSQADQRLCVALAEPLPAQAELELTLTWNVPSTGEQPHFAPDQVWAGYRTAAWLPTLQDPAQRATLTLTLVVPSALRVAASGERRALEPLSNGRTRHAFALTQPSPPFLFAFAAGHFKEAELHRGTTTLRALGPKAADLDNALAITARMHDFFVARLGAPLPTAEYWQVFVHDDAAQEAAGLALISETALDDLRSDPKEDWVFAHELAHQWFGFRVPCADFSDFWLNEGFATFLVAAFKEQRWGRAAYERELRLWRARSAQVGDAGKGAVDSAGKGGSEVARPTALSLSNPALPARPAPSESELQPRGVTYARGALLLDKLRRELGESVFWAGLRRYVQERSFGGARSDDLRRALEAASARDLAPFFEKWVYRPAPKL